MKEPKSLYQSPSGAMGFAASQSCKPNRSSTRIERSFERCAKCVLMPRGKLVNWILGKSVLPKDRSHKVVAGLFYPLGIGFNTEAIISFDQLAFPFKSSFHALFGKRNNGSADRDAPLFCDCTNLFGKRNGQSNTLPYRLDFGAWGHALRLAGLGPEC